MAATFPENWQIAKDYDPNSHKMQLKGKDYLDVQNRLIWFIRDQRALIVAGLAKTSYVVQTEMVEHDAAGKWANFKTYVRDVLGNESTMYGSEGAKDFGDYLEKASTKSLGRALVMLGYGTQFAPEIGEEGDAERPVDSPVKRTAPQPPKPARAPQPQANAPTPETDIRYKVEEPSPTATTVGELVQISLVEQIKKLKDEVGVQGPQWERMKKAARTQDELLAKLQELADAKRDGFPLDRPAKKAQ